MRVELLLKNHCVLGILGAAAVIGLLVLPFFLESRWWSGSEENEEVKELLQSKKVNLGFPSKKEFRE